MLQSFFPYRLALTAESFSRQLTGVYQRQHGLSREEWRLLFLLAQCDSLSSRELSRATSLDKVQVSRAADRLERKGLILRDTHADDRRLRQYTCTEAGRALFATVFEQVDAQSRAILDRLSDSDRAALDRGLAALAQALATPRVG